MIDAVTERAERVREISGCSWEAACAQAESERDRGILPLRKPNRPAPDCITISAREAKRGRPYIFGEE